MAIQVQIAVEHFPIAGVFNIARGAKTAAEVITVTLERQGVRGRGECVPYKRYGETLESVEGTIASLGSSLADDLEPSRLIELLPAGAARNALDCALWDLLSRERRTPVHHLVGLPAPSPTVTAYTISLSSPTEMAEAAARAKDRPALKVKLGADDLDDERIRAVRRAHPTALLIADANEGWTPKNLGRRMAVCAEENYALIEQPLPAADDEFLRGVPHPVPLCADESFHDRTHLSRLKGLYEVVNLKLDKTGGLTEAVATAQAARTLGFDLMVGCMVGTSLAMAPALLLTSQARYVDLDGPLLLQKDRAHGLIFRGSLIEPPPAQLWGWSST